MYGPKLFLAYDSFLFYLLSLCIMHFVEIRDMIKILSTRVLFVRNFILCFSRDS